MVLRRVPRPALRHIVEALWAVDETSETRPAAVRREHVLPTGQMHLVYRLSDDPLRLFASVSDTSGHTVSEGVVGGARDAFYIREVSQPLRSVGAQLRPGAAEALFGVPADELAGRHTPLDELWGRPAASTRDQLAEIGSLEQRLDTFEAMLTARVQRARGLHPAVAQALEEFMNVTSIRDLAHRSGYSHRTFIALFRRSVGLTPKLYGRVQRFQRVLRALSQRSASWADVAATAGYSDQSHFNREFREFVGATPTEYRLLSPRFSHHLTVEGDRR
jgi:AraC-like DNA-binding protein